MLREAHHPSCGGPITLIDDPRVSKHAAVEQQQLATLPDMQWPCYQVESMLTVLREMISAQGVRRQSVTCTLLVHALCCIVSASLDWYICKTVDKSAYSLSFLAVCCQSCCCKSLAQRWCRLPSMMHIHVVCCRLEIMAYCCLVNLNQSVMSCRCRTSPIDILHCSRSALQGSSDVLLVRVAEG